MSTLNQLARVRFLAGAGFFIGSPGFPRRFAIAPSRIIADILAIGEAGGLRLWFSGWEFVLDAVAVLGFVELVPNFGQTLLVSVVIT